MSISQPIIMPNQDQMKEKIKKALKKDFRKLYVKGFSTNWEAERMVIESKIDVMRLEALMELFQSEMEEMIGEDENLYEKERKSGKFDWRVERETGGNEVRYKLRHELLTKLNERV